MDEASNYACWLVQTCNMKRCKREIYSRRRLSNSNTRACHWPRSACSGGCMHQYHAARYVNGRLRRPRRGPARTPEAAQKPSSVGRRPSCREDADMHTGNYHSRQTPLGYGIAKDPRCSLSPEQVYDQCRQFALCDPLRLERVAYARSSALRVAARKRGARQDCGPYGSTRPWRLITG